MATSAPGFEVWGLTGGIASGKSLAAKIFMEEGFQVLDADLLARELGSPGGAAHTRIVERFGTDDRAKLRQIVFAAPSARLDLEAILHPLIQSESLRRLQNLAVNAPEDRKTRILYEAALLVETGRYRQLTGLIVIDAPRELRRKRLIERDGVSAELADQIMGAQISDEERIKAATHVVRNVGTVEELRVAIRDLVAHKLS